MKRHQIDIARWLQEAGITSIERLAPNLTGSTSISVSTPEEFCSTPFVELAPPLPSPTRNQNTETIGSRNSLKLRPDESAFYYIPLVNKEVAYCFHDALDEDGVADPASPRNQLKKIVALYKSMGWEVGTTVEIEFYLIKAQKDPNKPFEPVLTTRAADEKVTGITECVERKAMCQAIGQIYALCKNLDSTLHESSFGESCHIKIEINNDNPIAISDKTLILKTVIKSICRRLGIDATFMAKPMSKQAGSSMKISHRVNRETNGTSVLSSRGVGISKTCQHFIAGIQRYNHEAFIFFAPNINSYRRYVDAPNNVEWSTSGSITGIGVNTKSKSGISIEYRLAGADCNPYLAISALLSCGHAGIKERIIASNPKEENNNEFRTIHPPRTLEEALEEMTHSSMIERYFDATLISEFTKFKTNEATSFKDHISTWERSLIQPIV